jgi:hypothetical protein
LKYELFKKWTFSIYEQNQIIKKIKFKTLFKYEHNFICEQVFIREQIWNMKKFQDWIKIEIWTITKLRNYEN